MTAVMASSPRATREARIAFRLSRREVLDSVRPPDCSVILNEAVFHEMIGGPAVMAEQLRYLLSVGERSMMTVQVLPLGTSAWHAAHAGPFLLLEFADQNPIVHLEHCRTTAFVRNVRDIRDYQEALADIRGRAMSSAESRGFIRSRVEAIEGELR